jgi:hypothetical protein
VKNKILYAPQRHRMITPIKRYPSLGLNPSSWTHRSPGVIVNELNVREAINSFPAGSLPGLDGMRPQYLKDIIS